MTHHVRLDYESVRDGRRTSEWDFWFDAMKIPRAKPASTLRFPQYDQLVAAAIEGSGIGLGVLPHTAEHLRQKVLCAPFGMEAVALRGTLSSAGRTLLDATPSRRSSTGCGARCEGMANVRRHPARAADGARHRASHAAFQKDDELNE